MFLLNMQVRKRVGQNSSTLYLAEQCRFKSQLLDLLDFNDNRKTGSLCNSDTDRESMYFRN